MKARTKGNVEIIMKYSIFRYSSPPPHFLEEGSCQVQGNIELFRSNLESGMHSCSLDVELTGSREH